jgi:hypothetical protein
MKIVVVVRRTGDDELKVKAEASDANEAVRMRPTTESNIITVLFLILTKQGGSGIYINNYLMGD